MNCAVDVPEASEIAAAPMDVADANMTFGANMKRMLLV